MANIKSSAKRHLQSLKRRARNIVVRNEVKVAVKGARGAIAEKDASKSTESLKLATKALDKAASKGVISKRAASRRIGRLARAAHRASQA